MLSMRGHHYRFDQVPDVFKELFIISGYRHPKSSAKQCLLSLFEGNNETLNVWTHFLPTWYFLWRFLALWNVLDFTGDSYAQPLLAYMITVCVYPFFSAVAHAFNTMSIRARHICFMIDYASLSIYSYGAAVAYRSYAFPEFLNGTFYAEIYLPVAFILSILCTFFSSLSRFLEAGTVLLKVCRLSAFAIPCLWVSVPVLSRVVFCALTSQGCLEIAVIYNAWQYFFVFTAAFLYATHMPERFHPGKFDIIGHSHQLFHCCSVLASNCQINALLSDLSHRKDRLMELGSIPSFHQSVGLMVTIAVINVLIVMSFAVKLHFMKIHEDDRYVPLKSKCH